jgi:hypothetical protein
MAKADLSAERARELLDYDPATGAFTHKAWRGHGRRPGEVAGCLHSQSGYRRISIDGHDYQAHRLVWLWVHGRWPENFIDHINGRRDDNRLENLRDVHDMANRENRRNIRRDSATGFQGVALNGKRFSAYIRVSGRRLHLGTHDTPEAAHAAYVEAKRRLHAGSTI